MRYDLYTFETKERARRWLLKEGFSPCIPCGAVLGLWCDGVITVQAFQNLSNTWSVQRHHDRKPNPDHFICE